MKWVQEVESCLKSNFYHSLAIAVKSLDMSHTMFVIKTNDITYIASVDTIDKLPIDVEKDAIQISMWKNN